MKTKVIAIIPAHNEQGALPGVLKALQVVEHDEIELTRIVVVDNASSDDTAHVAKEWGAHVVREEQLGYGAACLCGMREIGDEDVVLFIDADGSDQPAEWPSLVMPIVREHVDLVVGSRTLGKSEAGALLFHQRLGNILATWLLSLIYDYRFTDLGPFRAIRKDALLALGMQDRAFGWTVEMQILALRGGLACAEVPVSYGLRKAGKSKVAGSIRGSYLAATTILGFVGKEIAYLCWRRIFPGSTLEKTRS